jgi:hypothetical protein
MDMDNRDLARLLGLGRVVLGAASFLSPSRFGRMWTGERAETALTSMAIRGLGARDVAIGIGILVSLDQDKPVRGWLEAAALADAADALGTLAAWHRLPGFRRLGLLALEAGAAVLAVQLADELD